MALPEAGIWKTCVEHRPSLSKDALLKQKASDREEVFLRLSLLFNNCAPLKMVIMGCKPM